MANNSNNALLQLMVQQQIAAQSRPPPSQQTTASSNAAALLSLLPSGAANGMAQAQLQAYMLQMLMASQLASQASRSRPPPGSFEEAVAKIAPKATELEPGEVPRSQQLAATPRPPFDSAPSPSSIDSIDTAKRRAPVTDAAIVRVPLAHKWKRQTYIRELTANGVKGDVVYFAPCGKKLASYSEVIRYLTKYPNAHYSRDHFTFSSKVVVGDFLVVRKGENGTAGVSTFTEDDVKNELKRQQDERLKKLEEERERREAPLRERKEAIRKEREALKDARKKEKEERDKLEKERREAMKDEEKEKDEGDGEKGRRKPMEDLLLEEIRPLPDFSRIDNLQLDGNAFAEALMVSEFLHNFQESLDIDTLPSLASLCCGLAGDSSHGEGVSSLLSSLLSRCLVLLPQSRRIETPTGSKISEVFVNPSNRDELLRLFLSTADGGGAELSSLLSTSSFGSLSSSQKASILGCLVNQLLCCSAVTRQLDSHLEELSRLKGDRWMKDGKIRALRAVQERKKKKRKNDDEGERSPSRCSSEGREESEGGRVSPKQKNHTPGIGQCEVLTAEEEAMGTEEIEEAVAELASHSDDLSLSIHQLNSRVRVFPFGEDRYHRMYWQLGSEMPVLVEGMESGHGETNPACDMTLPLAEPPDITTLSESFVDPDVVACLEDIVDSVVNGRVDKDRKKRFRKIGNAEKRGWWTVAPRHLEQWRANLHGRGNRERCVHRLLLRQKFLDEIHLGSLAVHPVLKTSDEGVGCLQLEESLVESIRDLRHALVQSGFLMKEETEGRETGGIDGRRREILSMEEAVDRKYLQKEKGHDEEESEEGQEVKVEEGIDRLIHWRQFVQSAPSLHALCLAVQLLSSSINWQSSSFWCCCMCSSPSPSSSPSLLCSECSSASVHPHCLSLCSLPEPFRCSSCLPKAILPSEEAVEVEGEEAEEEERRTAKRRAEPNSFVVPSSNVAELARAMLDEMEQQRGVGPFLAPVPLDEIPEYGLMIEKPMDLGTIRARVDDGWYEDADDFYSEVELVFSNCRTFNEDDSPIGEAGIRIHKFFTKRWRQLKYNLSKRVKRQRN